MISLSNLHKRKVHFMEGNSCLNANNIVETLIRSSVTNPDSKKSKDSHYIAEILTVPSAPSSIVKEKPSIIISFINNNAEK